MTKKTFKLFFFSDKLSLKRHSSFFDIYIIALLLTPNEYIFLDIQKGNDKNRTFPEILYPFLYKKKLSSTYNQFQNGEN